MYIIIDIVFIDVEFIVLIVVFDVWQEIFYLVESNYLLDFSQLLLQMVIVLVICSLQGEVVGCGVIVFSEEGFGEMKWVYIDFQYCGQQLGEKLLVVLEVKVCQCDCYILCLEIGIYQYVVIVFYMCNGYQICCVFVLY